MSIFYRPILMGLSIILPYLAFSQNAFLELFNRKHTEITPLITDSLVIKTANLSRYIRYYDVQDAVLPADYKEIQISNDGNLKQRIFSHTEGFGNSFVNTIETLDSITGLTYKERLTFFGQNISACDSMYLEIWSDEQWVSIQKTLNFYGQNGKPSETLIYLWDKAALEWIPYRSTAFNYDGSKRLITKEISVWKEEWALVNQYMYTYQGNLEKPVTINWKSGDGGSLNPVDSSLVWFDAFGQEDSIAVFNWSPETGKWYEVYRNIFTDLEQRKSGNGKKVGISLEGDRITKEDWIHYPGEMVYSDEPSESLQRVYFPDTDTWRDQFRMQLKYQKLNDNSIYGTITHTAFNENVGAMETVFAAEAWFHEKAEKPAIDSVEDRSGKFTFTYQCGFSNPYVMNQTVYFPSTEAKGDFELKILSEEGRLVYQQRYDSSGVGKVSVPLPPGLYVVAVSRGGQPLCTQKLIVQ
jgi:hypothetical protein